MSVRPSVRPSVHKKFFRIQFWWDILLSEQILAVIKQVVDDHIICLTATYLKHATAHTACISVQQLLCKTLNLVSLEL